MPNKIELIKLNCIPLYNEIKVKHLKKQWSHSVRAHWLSVTVNIILTQPVTEKINFQQILIDKDVWGMWRWKNIYTFLVKKKDPW